jgi:large subunit ribosomal protein L4
MAVAPVLDVNGKRARDVELEIAVFGAEVKQHLVHEAVRAELAAARAGTRGAKSRGMVAGGASKPWRQKGTGRARQGTTRAPQWTGGGVAFPPTSKSFALKVNRRARKAALRSALSAHAGSGSLAVLDGSVFDDGPTTKAAVALLSQWGADLPLLIVVEPHEQNIAKSFRNLPRALIVESPGLQVSEVVWARSLLLTEGALTRVQEVAAP